MARGEGAEQYAASLLSVKPINTDIKAAKVRGNGYAEIFEILSE